MLPEIDGANAVPFAEKMRQIVEKTEFKFENTRIPVTISMGVAVDGRRADRVGGDRSSAPTNALRSQSQRPQPRLRLAPARRMG